VGSVGDRWEVGTGHVRGRVCGGRERSRETRLCHLGGVRSIDEIAHDREPRAARQADVEPIHVHAHERGVRGLDRRKILL